MRAHRRRTKWSHKFGWLQERAIDMIHLCPEEMLQVGQCLDRRLGVRGPLPRSGACNDKVMGTEVTDTHRWGNPFTNVPKM